MKFEKINKSNLKYLIPVLLVIIGLSTIFIFKTSRSSYKFEKSYPLVKGTINYTLPDLNVVAMYQQASKGSTSYNEIDKAPTSGFKVNTEKSYCGAYNENGGIDKDSSITLSNLDGGGVGVHGLKKGTRCMVYFDYEDRTSSEMLAVLRNLNSSISSSSGATSFTGLSTSNEGLKSGTDNDGTTYYFRGAVNNNWVKIGSMYFRIIRINGDGTVRLIYSGITAPTSSTATVMTGTGTQLDGTSAFNSSYQHNAYVGYMWGSTSSSTYADVHRNTNNSMIKVIVDTWYSNNSSTLSSKVDVNAGFCGDRKVVTGTYSNYNYTGNGTGTALTAYAPMSRFFGNNGWARTQKPVFTCSQTNDLYTSKSSNKGNKALNYPVGLITADEVVYAGGSGGASNSSYYLYTNQNYWTMSPDNTYTNGNAHVFDVDSNGTLANYFVNGTIGVRPVINLKSSLTWSGTGTYNSPFMVS